MIVEYKRF